MRERAVRLTGLVLLWLLAWPRPGDGAVQTAEVIEAAVFSDFNGPYGATGYSPIVPQVVRRITHVWRPDIVLSAGDMIAGQSPRLVDARFPQMWRAFDAAVAGPLRTAGIPFAFSLGNHDASAARDAGGGYRFDRERAHAAGYWRDPVHKPRLDYLDERRFPFAYSFLFKDIFFLAVDASSHIIQDPDWVLATLAGPSARRARIRIVVGHLPLYGISEGRSKPGEVIAHGERWREIFEAHQVDLYLSGHHAAYYPAHRGALTLLHSGGGVGARKYVGYPEIPARSTVTLMRINLRTRALAFVTYDVETGERVDLNTLPPCINGHNGAVFRQDLRQASTCPQQR